MNLEERTIALAGICQGAHLVEQLAKTGLVDCQAFESIIYSTLQLNAATTEEVYGGLVEIKTGLRILCTQLSFDAKTVNMNLIHYIVNIMTLERKLSRREKMLTNIRTAIELASQQAEIHGITDPIVIETLATAYKNTLSTLKPTIQVSGERNILQNPINASKIRALLLGCIRSAVLWRQKGGSRWRLLWSRNKILRTATQLLQQIE